MCTFFLNLSLFIFFTHYMLHTYHIFLNFLNSVFFLAIAEAFPDSRKLNNIIKP